jgi:two-component system sensor histidine kinase KdpD
MTAKDIEKNWPVRERLAVCISSNPSGQYLIARGARMARRLDAELYVVHVDAGAENQGPGNKSLEANIRFAGDLGAKVVRIKGKSVADTMAAFAREKHVTQVIFGRADVKGLRKLFYLSAIHRFLRDAPAVDVHIVTHQDPD